METHIENTATSSIRKVGCTPSLTAEEKLKLIEDPARAAISQLRILADDDALGICEQAQCSMSNLALWLEGVLDENPGYMPRCSETARIKLGWPTL